MGTIDIVRDPVPGETISPSWARDVVRAIRASKVLAGPGVRVDHGPEGQRVRTVGAAVAAASGAPEDPWRLVISYDGSDYTATLSNLFAGWGTATDEFNGGVDATLVLSGTAGDRYLGASITMSTHAVVITEHADAALVLDPLPDTDSDVVRLPLYHIYKSAAGGYSIRRRLWNMPKISWHE